MSKPVQRYVATYRKGREMAEMTLEAKSDRGAARIAASFQYRDIGYYTPFLKLENILRFNPASGAFEGQRNLETLVERIPGKRRIAA